MRVREVLGCCGAELYPPNLLWLLFFLWEIQKVLIRMSSIIITYLMQPEFL